MLTQLKQYECRVRLLSNGRHVAHFNIAAIDNQQAEFIGQDWLRVNEPGTDPASYEVAIAYTGYYCYTYS